MDMFLATPQLVATLYFLCPVRPAASRRRAHKHHRQRGAEEGYQRTYSRMKRSSGRSLRAVSTGAGVRGPFSLRLPGSIDDTIEANSKKKKIPRHEARTILGEKETSRTKKTHEATNRADSRRDRANQGHVPRNCLYNLFIRPKDCLYNPVHQAQGLQSAASISEAWRAFLKRGEHFRSAASISEARRAFPKRGEHFRSTASITEARRGFPKRGVHFRSAVSKKKNKKKNRACQNSEQCQPPRISGQSRARCSSGLVRRTSRAMKTL